MELLADVLLDAVIDTAKLLPFLFLTYLAMEYLEEHAGGRTPQILAKTQKAGPLLGGLFGIVPQCGFSSAAASLYSGGLITTGTLIAVFLSTSDEMLPIFISGKVPPVQILQILGLKAVCGVIAGFVFDAVLRVLHRRKKEEIQTIHDLCEHDHCHCETGGILRSALKHTLQVTAFIFAVNILLGFAAELIGMARLMRTAQAYPLLSIFVSALIGLIPNCASSVAITTLYMEGVLSFGSMMAGLLSCAGIGMAVLFRTNRKLKKDVSILGACYIASVLFGLFFQLIV
ncbi:MAG: putative manganese transporter [Eubacteriales bacterium]|nr:putative manganese transporter [Eubacteriales bacterium]